MIFVRHFAIKESVNNGFHRTIFWHYRSDFLHNMSVLNLRVFLKSQQTASSKCKNIYIATWYPIKDPKTL